MAPQPHPVDSKPDEVLVGPPHKENLYESANGAHDTASNLENDYKRPFPKSEQSYEVDSTSPRLSNGVASNGCQKSSRRPSRFESRSEESSESLESLLTLEDGEDARDSLVDTIPFGMDCIQTVIKGQLKKDINSKSFESCLEELSLESELERTKEENAQLRKALKEAAYVNQKWRNYHDHKQNFLHKLQTTINELRKEASEKQHTGGTAVAELKKLKESLTLQQKEHHERIQLLQAQVRAHRDDWEAERCERQIAEAGRMQAERQVDMLQKIFHHLMTKMAALEERQKLCRCCHNLTNGLSPTIEENFHSNAVPSKERLERRSPSKHSSSSSGNRSRSSSLNCEFSNPSSPVFTKSHLGVSHSRRSTSPRSRRSSPGSSSARGVQDAPSKTEIQVKEDHVDALAVAKKPAVNQGFQMKDSNSSSEQSTKAKQKEARNSYGTSIESGEGEKNAPNSTSCTTNNATSSQPQEIKGAKSKSLPKLSSELNNNEELDAKHRARTILASALPMSPSPKNPSSPVTATPTKNPSKNPLTTTSHHKFRPPFVAHKRPKSVSSSQFPKNKDHKEDKLRSNGNKRDLRSMKRISAKAEAENGSSIKNDQEKDQETDSSARYEKNQNAKSNCERTDMEEACNACGANSNAITNGKSELVPVCDNRKETMTEEKCVTVKSEVNAITKGSTNVKSLSCNANKGINSDESLKHDKNTKADSPNEAPQNPQSDANSNYTSITVISNSSTIHPQSQVTSTTSSRSSSPGISLMTFALNAEGQGVPGAILFAMGPEGKSSKTVQTNIQSLSVTSSSNGVDPRRESNQDRCPGIAKAAECSPNNHGGRLVNSAWVKLMDKENNPSRSSNGIPWRTARAVPSHQLNSSRKASSEENPSSDNCSNYEMTPQACNYIQSKSVQPAPEVSGQIKKATNELRVTNDSNCSTCSYSVSGGEINTVVREIPTIICASPCMHANLQSKESSPISVNEVDLKSLASRNITSAILSYECNNKESKGSHSKTNKSYLKHKSQKTYMVGGSSDSNGWASMHCLICPRCQMLFHEEQMHSFTKHIQICGGPKYVDM